MTALTDNRNTPLLNGEDPVDKYTVLAAEKLYAGGMLARDYADEVQEASDTQGLKVLGISGIKVDNTDDGESQKRIERGIVRLANSVTYPISRPGIGQVAYVEDDQIVGAYSTNLVVAGLVHDVDSDGVWVDMRPAAMAAALAMRPPVRVAKTADYTVTAAIALSLIHI